jgi:NAD(P)-dependent dehydrogenase (short-subunit alcohol dehydrogenase family)
LKRSIFSLENKTVCLTGATGLIGKTLTKDLLSAGAYVYAGARNIKNRENKKNLFYECINIADEHSIKSFIGKVIQKRKKIDVWINCAYPKVDYKDKRVEKISTSQILEDLQGHLLGYFNCCRFVLEVMKFKKAGSIINFGSIYGEVVPDFRIYENTEIKKDAAYFMNKSGIHILTKYFAVLGAKYNVRVNTVAPGGIFDDHSKIFAEQYAKRVPLGRMARSGEMSGPVIFLASEASSYMTGQTLLVDGGLTAW